MQFDLTEPVAAPADVTMACVADLDALLAGLSSGRMTIAPTPGAADRWRVLADLAGKTRRGEVWVHGRVPGQGYCIGGALDSLLLDGAVHVGAGRAAGHSDLRVTLRLSAGSIKGRVMLSGLYMMQDAIADRLSHRLARLARHIEETAAAG